MTECAVIMYLHEKTWSQKDDLLGDEEEEDLQPGRPVIVTINDPENP